jgi:hypothetical protein
MHPLSRPDCGCHRHLTDCDMAQGIPFDANAKWIIAFAFWADANVPLIDLVEGRLRAISEQATLGGCILANS